MRRHLRGGAHLALLLGLVVAGPGAFAQGTCTDISDQCLTTDPTTCSDVVGGSVTVQLGGPGAEDSNETGGVCGAVDATALVTFTKTAADQLRVDVENTTCEDSSLTAVWFNITEAVNALTKASPFTDPDPTTTAWNLAYSQTMADSDGFGFRADGFGNFDAAIFNGTQQPQGGNPAEILSGDTVTFFVDVDAGYDLCDLLTAISEPPPGDRNRTTVARFQSCGDAGDSAMIGPCTPVDDLLAVLRAFWLDANDRRVVVEWETSLEVRNAGFNVLRREARGGGWSYVNASFIPGAGDSVSGASYRFEDTSALNGVEYQYRIEDVDFDGKNTLHGIDRAVANPRNPAVKLQSPSYGERVRLERGLTVAYQGMSVVHGSARLQFSPDATFEDVLEVRAPIRHGINELRLNGRLLRGLGELAGDDGVLYWRLADTSDTFRMEVN